MFSLKEKKAAGGLTAEFQYYREATEKKQSQVIHGGAQWKVERHPSCHK